MLGKIPSKKRQRRELMNRILRQKMSHILCLKDFAYICEDCGECLEAEILIDTPQLNVNKSRREEGARRQTAITI